MTEEEMKAEIAKLTAIITQLNTDLEAAKKSGSGQPANQAEIDAKVQEALAPIKSKLDAAYAARDEALGKVAESDRLQKEALKKQLEADGKHKELAEMRIAEQDAVIKDLQKANTELARNNEVRAVLASLEFRNDRSAEIGFKEITSDLIKNDQGVWVHKSGKSIKDFITQDFAKDDTYSFLFKPKTNSGGGSGSVTTVSGEATGSLFKRTQAEVLADAAAGRLPHQQKKT